MPKLDGISATNLIRQFDHMTPIISMTSNSKPNEILTYYSSGTSILVVLFDTVTYLIRSGMNDILPKPFTRDGLMGILEVCRTISRPDSFQYSYSLEWFSETSYALEADS